MQHLGDPSKNWYIKNSYAIIALNAPGPKTAVIKIAIISAGNAKIKSLNLITRSSKNVPLFAAAINPKGKPNNIPIPLQPLQQQLKFGSQP